MVLCSLKQQEISGLRHLLRHPVEVRGGDPVGDGPQLREQLGGRLIDALRVPLLGGKPQEPVRHRHVGDVDAAEGQ
ncbi:MAG: hypothetical protein ACKOHK_10210, partial [Planctomycetia bacterium]